MVESGRYIGRAEVESFEEALAGASGVPFAVGVSNGLDALRMIFRAYIALGRLEAGRCRNCAGQHLYSVGSRYYGRGP